MAHVIYNCLTGVAALMLLIPYVEVAEHINPSAASTQSERVRTERLLDRIDRPRQLRAPANDPALTDASRIITGLVERFGNWLNRTDDLSPEDVEFIARALDTHRRRFRSTQIAEAVGGLLSAEEIDTRLDTMRWLARVAAHVWRVTTYLSPAAPVDVALTQRLETGD
ncbi:MAG: hypothetical protein GY925_12220 [Actinomycetia bacterium]|nr:hypothetical protein [Actinomycetes bacterium]